MIGGFIATDATTGVPTITGAPGIWTPKEIYDYSSLNVWPMAQNFAWRPTTKGYIVNGEQPGLGLKSCQRFTYTTETVANTTMTTDVEITYNAANATTANIGYACGGYGTTWTNNSYRCAYATETLTTMSNMSWSARYATAGNSSPVKGYFAGGSTGVYLQDMCMLAMATETFLNMGATMSRVGNYWGCPARNQSKGYFIGCADATSYPSTVNRFSFITETISVAPSYSSTGGIINGMTKNEAYPVNMYGCGGTSSSSGRLTAKASFATETWSTISATGMSEAAKGWSHRFGLSQFGYALRGYSAGTNHDRFSFDTETAATFSAGTINASSMAHNLGS